MKPTLRRLFECFQVPIDLALSVLAIPAAYILFCYRRIGSARLPVTTKLLQRIGLFPIMRHYYEPLFNTEQLHKPLSEDRHLPGIDLNVAGQLAFIKSLTHAQELRAMRLNEPATDATKFALGNISFEAGDADFLYQFIRTVKPAKVLEIGSGNSTKIAHAALHKNKEEGSKNSAHLCIEPYEMPWLERLEGLQVIRKRVEMCDFNWANELKSGDLLFIDSSHIIRPQSDVLTEYLEILPQLASGVYVHIHDIFTPRDYLESVIIKDVRFWNEQYLLEALLSNTQRYEIIGALNFLKRHHFDALQAVCPYMEAQHEPGSFYIRVR